MDKPPLRKVGEKIDRRIQVSNEGIEKRQLDEGLNRWEAAFNELCSDGIFRPVFICPRFVTGIKQLDPPHKIGDCTANTSISYHECGSFAGAGKSGEIFVFETIATVLSALGTMIAASDNYNSNFYFAGKYFEERGIKYCPELRQPPPAIDS